MPVPVSTTNPESKGLSVHQNRELPSAGGLFAKLGTHSAEAGLAAKQAEHAQGDRKQSSNGVRAAASKDELLKNFEYSVEVNNLEFKYIGDDGLPLPGPPCLSNVNLRLRPGSRMLLVGANGAGKTTLLRVLGGKHMVPKEAVRVLGQPPFHTTALTTNGLLSYIGGNWEREVAFAGYSVPFAGDFPARQMLDSVPGVCPERRKRLVEVLDIDEEWRMHLVSDGQRRRVQIAVGLLRPADVLLLDEVTVDLDVLVREDLMDFLKEESETRGCTVIYITHIFDGLEDWPSHIGFLANGGFEDFRAASEIPELREGQLMELVEAFLSKHRRLQEEARLKEGKPHPEAQKFTYLRNNGYGAGRLNTTLA